MSEQRELILARACDIYLTEGLDGLSMRKLARQVGVTAPALYRHYDGREALLADVLRTAYRAFTRYIYRALSAPTPAERFFGAGQGYLDFVIEHPRWYGILHTSPEALGIESLPPDIESMGQAVNQFWADRVRECMDAGILKRDDPEKVALTMWAHARGLVQIYHEGRCPMDEQEFRALFHESSARLMGGVATSEFTSECAAESIPVAEAAAASDD